MRVLIIDDEYEKAADIQKVVLASAPLAQVRHVSSSQAARVEMRACQFDLVFIDLNLPATLGDAQTRDGGFAFFDLMVLDEHCLLPTDFIFITALEDLIESATVEAQRRGGALCFYSAAAVGWRVLVNGRIALLQAKISRAGADTKFDIVLVTALRDPELVAALALSQYNWRDFKHKDFWMPLHKGIVPQNHLSIVATSALRMGMPSSAALATKLVHVFRPKYVVMIGICAGIEGRTNFGDVVIADPAWDWGSGKLGGVTGTTLLSPAPHQHALDPELRARVDRLKNDAEILSSIRAGWALPVPSGKLTVHLGPMASGASVIADQSVIDSIKEQHRSLLAVEMEAYAVMSAVEYSSAPKPIGVAIKSVCDHGTAEKSDDWQKYAAYTSAAFADQLFRRLA